MVGDSVTILKGKEVHAKLLKGSKEAADAVSTTFGPYGRNVAITMKYNVPSVTKDGATVAGFIKLKDPAENVAAQLINQAANETAKVAGDGTTSTTILTSELIHAAFKLIETGEQPMQLKRELISVQETVLQHLETLSKPVTEANIKSIALVACNGDEEIATIVTEAFKVVGMDGHVTVADSRSYETTMDATDGIKLDRSHILPSLAIGRTLVRHKNCKIAVLDMDITSLEDALTILKVQEELGVPMLVICNDLTGTAAEVIAFNKEKYKIDVEFIRAPFIAEARKEAMIDLSCVAGATLLSKNAGWEVTDFLPTHCGNSDSVEMTLKETNIIGRLGDKDAIAERVKFYEDKIKNDKEGLVANYKKRLAFFTSGAAVIYTGGSNETEVGEKKDRLDDTIRAVRSAMEEGFVLGGGLTYMTLAEKLIDKDLPAGSNILGMSLLQLMQRILDNSGIITADEHKQNVIDLDVIDPTLVIKSTIINAIGAAIMIFTTDCIIIREED
jgi:chaperonin GroEL